MTVVVEKERIFGGKFWGFISAYCLENGVNPNRGFEDMSVVLPEGNCVNVTCVITKLTFLVRF